MNKNILWKKGLVIAIILLFLGMTIVPSTAINVVKEKSSPQLFSSGNTLYVGGSGPNNYSEIQDAVDDAVGGDTVFVYDDSSPYYENIVVNKSISLIGEDKNSTIIDADGVGSVVYLDGADDITVSGFTLQNSGDYHMGLVYDSGIEMGRGYQYFNNWIVTDNFITDNMYGIHVSFSNDCVISKNIIKNNREDGIHIWPSGFIEITYNIVKDNVNTGIYIHAEDSFIFGNIVEYNSDGIYAGSDISENIVRYNNRGIVLDYDGRIYKNNVTDNIIGIFVYAANLVLDFDPRVANNNLINNNNHVSFYSNYFMLFFFTIPKIKWNSNYYEGHTSGPKIIKGTLYLFLILPPIVYYEKEIVWYNIDLKPAKVPYYI